MAEKYLQLARDAHTGGDPVAAENYLQHAEHYFRLIAAAQAAQALAQSGQSRQSEGESDDFDEDDDFGAMSDRFASPAERAAYSQQQNFAPPGPTPAIPNAPQPYVDRLPFEQERQNQGERGGNFQPRHDRQGNRFQDRPRPPQAGDRNENFRDRQNRDNRVREFRPYRDQAPPNGAPEAAAPAALPSFITAAPRPNVPEPEPAALSADAPSFGVVEAPDASAPLADASSEARFPGRGRRRRLRSPYGFNASQNEGDSDRPETPAPDEKPIEE